LHFFPFKYLSKNARNSCAAKNELPWVKYVEASRQVREHLLQVGNNNPLPFQRTSSQILISKQISSYQVTPHAIQATGFIMTPQSLKARLNVLPQILTRLES
jgi:hypothetical protein